MGLKKKVGAADALAKLGEKELTVKNLPSVLSWMNGLKSKAGIGQYREILKDITRLGVAMNGRQDTVLVVLKTAEDQALTKMRKARLK